MQDLINALNDIVSRGKERYAPIGYVRPSQSPSLRTGGIQSQMRRMAERDESETSLIRHAVDNAGIETVRRNRPWPSDGTGAEHMSESTGGCDGFRSGITMSGSYSGGSASLCTDFSIASLEPVSH